MLSLSNVIYSYNNNFETLSPSEQLVAKSIYVLTPYSILFIMLDALRRFKSCDLKYNKQYAIEDKQIVFQTVSYLAFALGDTVRVFWFKKEYLYFVYVVCNTVSYCMLMITIWKMTEL